MPATSAQSASSLGFEPLPSDSNLKSHQEARGSDTSKAQTSVKDGGRHRNQEAFRASMYDSYSAERREGGYSIGQQRGSIRSDQAPQRAAAMQ